MTEKLQPPQVKVGSVKDLRLPDTSQGIKNWMEDAVACVPPALRKELGATLEERAEGLNLKKSRFNSLGDWGEYGRWRKQSGGLNEIDTVARDLTMVAIEMERVFEAGTSIEAGEVVEGILKDAVKHHEELMPDSTEQREEMLAPYQNACEQVLKARQVMDIVSIIGEKLGASAEEDRENIRAQRIEVVNFAYGEMAKSGGREGDYGSFCEEFERLVRERKRVDQSKLGELLNKDEMLLPWLYMTLRGDDTEYRRVMSIKLINHNNLEPMLITGVLGKGGDKGKVNKTFLNEQALPELTKIEQYPSEEQESHIPSCFLGIDINLGRDVMGKESVWQTLMERGTLIKDQNLTLSVPLTIEEAKYLASLEVDLKSDLVRTLIVSAHNNRKATMVLHAGFGGSRDVYANEFWPELASEFSDIRGHDNEIPITSNPGAMMKAWTQRLSQRISTISVDVMAAGMTGAIDDTIPELGENPASMMTNALYLSQIKRAMGCLEQSVAPTITLDIGHSMSGQITLRSLIFDSYSMRENLRYLSLTPVATTKFWAMSFVNSGINNLFKLIIKTKNSGKKPVKKFGNILDKLGVALKIRRHLLKQFTHPYTKSVRDKRIGQQLADAHDNNLVDSKRLYWQLQALYNEGEWTMDDMLPAVGVVGGARCQVLLGGRDRVLNTKWLSWAFQKYPQIYRLIYGDKRQGGGGGERVTKVRVVPGAAHYFEANLPGREAIVEAVGELLG